MVGDNRKYNIALVTLLCEGATGELPGNNNLAGVALEVPWDAMGCHGAMARGRNWEGTGG